MITVLISACLLGCDCRYDGKNCYVEQIEQLKDKCILIPICPEQMGGLPTPRIPSEIQEEVVINKEGVDVTAQYSKGAKLALEYAKLNDTKYAILKSKSPSCGRGLIYDGSFTGHLIEGDGKTVQLLKENGIKIYTEQEIDVFLREVMLTLSENDT